MKDLVEAEKRTRETASDFMQLLENYFNWASEDEDLIDETPTCKEENQAYKNLEATIDSAVKELLTVYEKYKSSEKEREALYNELFKEEEEEEEEEEE